ncbi:MAG: hypothetical protein JWO36_609, partial [Myxococcales bacterium]|nr:hypothetical protein [Myxococcales bacterium]
MKRALLIVALCVSGVAYAQTAAPAPAAPAATGSATAATGSATPAAGSATAATGSATPTAGSTEAGSAVTGNGGPNPDMKPADIDHAAGAAQAQGTGPTGTPAAGTPQTNAPKGPLEKAWYDKLADLPIQESGNFWMPKAVNIAADDSDMM